jgi:hypothetical protein
MGSPTTQRISIHRTKQRLRDRLEQLIGSQVRLPQALAHAEQLVARCAAHDEVLSEVDAADAVEAADKGFTCGICR